MLKSRTSMVGRLVAAAALVLGAQSAMGQSFADTEPNDNKTGAQSVVLTTSADGLIGSITGSSTGTSTTVPGTGSADYFRITTAAAPLGIYEYTVQLVSGGQTVTIRGLNQTTGTIGTADTTVQTASGDRVQWYGFGKQEQMYVRVTGSSTTTTPYTLRITRRAVQPIGVGAYLNAGSITVTTDGQGHTSNTDLWVYDSNFNPVADFGNDDIVSGNTRSTATGALSAGTYYVAIANQNLANNLASPASDFNRSQPVLDFANAVLNSSTSTSVNVGLSISDGSTSVGVPLVRPNVFDVQFVRFDLAVAPTISVTATSSTAIATPGSEVTIGLVINASPNAVTSATLNASSLGASSSIALADDGNIAVSGDVTAGDGVYSGKFVAPATSLGGRFPLSFGVSDSGGRTVTGAFTQDVAPANEGCLGAIALVDSELLAGKPITINNFFAMDDAYLTPCASTTATTTPQGVWFSYTPPADRLLTFEESGSQSVVFAAFGACSDFIAIRCADSSTSNTFLLTGGTTYLFLIGRDATTSSVNPQDIYEIFASASTVPAAPANDECVNAIDITVATFPITTTVAVGGARPDTDTSCNTGSLQAAPNGIWYKYTASADVIFQAQETDPDTFGNFAVYTACGGGEVACRLLGGTSPNAIPLSAGQTYFILISRDNFGPATADFDLFLNVVPNPTPNGVCAGAIEITSVPFSDTRNNAFAIDPPAVSCDPSIRAATWYRYTATKSQHVMYRESSSQDAGIVVFTGTCGGLVEYYCDSQFSPLADSTQHLRLEGGQTYYFMVYRDATSDPLATDVLTFQLYDASTLSAVPANDLCANATRIASAPYEDVVFHNGATNDFASACNSGPTGNTLSMSGVWYRYDNGPTSRTAIVETFEPNDTSGRITISVYAGTCPTASASEIVCDGDRDNPEAVTFLMSPNTTYYISFSKETFFQGRADELVPFRFDVAPDPAPMPVNVSCSSATPVVSVPFRDVVYSVNAPNENTDFACNNGATVNNAVWYSYTATANGYAVFSDESPQDAAIGVFNGCPATSGTEIRCASTADVGVVPMTIGETYYFLVGRFDSATNSGAADFWDFRLDFVSDPTNDLCSSAIPLTEFPYRGVFPIANLTSDAVPTTPCSVGTLVQNGVWFTFTARDSFILMAEELGPNTASRRFALYSGDCNNLTPVGCSPNSSTGDDFVTTSPVAMQVVAGQTYFLLVGNNTAVVTDINRQFWDLAIATLGSDVGRCSTGATCSLTIRQNCAGTFTAGVGPCRADFNCSSGLDVQDIFDFLNAWFAGNSSADYNNDTMLSVQDIFDFLNAWFAGCP